MSSICFESSTSATRPPRVRSESCCNNRPVPGVVRGDGDSTGRTMIKVDRLALTGLALLLGLVVTGCGAVASKGQSSGASPSTSASVLPASTLADLRNRPLKLPAMAAGGTCPTGSSHDLNPVINGGKGKGP